MDFLDVSSGLRGASETSREPVVLEGMKKIQGRFRGFQGLQMLFRKS